MKHEDFVKILESTGMDGEDTRLIRNLYSDQKAAVRIQNEMTGWIKIQRRVTQGYLLSPNFFSLYGQADLGMTLNYTLGSPMSKE